jgi:hypothetical protein
MRLARTTVARAATDAVSRLSPAPPGWLAPWWDLFTSASAGDEAQVRSAVGRPPSCAGSAGLGAGASCLNRRRMRMSLGTPVADGPPPVDAPFPSRPTWPEVPDKPPLSALPFPAALAFPGRQGGRQPPVQTAGSPSDGAGATVIRPARGPVSGATTHVTGPGLAGERLPTRACRRRRTPFTATSARSGPGLIDNQPIDERRRL